MNSSNTVAVVLAAGKGTRMKSSVHKVLHKLCGRPMIEYIINTLKRIGIEEIIVVVGHQAEEIKKTLKDTVKYAVQEHLVGTANAVLSVKEHLENYKGNVLVLSGDAPLFTDNSLKEFIESHQESNKLASILSCVVDDPTGYGRLIRDSDEELTKLVEHKDSSKEELLVKEVNTGTYIFSNQELFSSLEKINNNNAQNEYYLPDIFNILEFANVNVCTLTDSIEAMGINDRIQLSIAQEVLQKRIIHDHMRNGVTFDNSNTTYVEDTVKIGSDSTISQGCQLKGETVIGSHCNIGPFSELTSVIVNDNCNISFSVIKDTNIDKNVSVGPYAYIRPGTYLEQDVRIGAFVDLKKVNVGQGTKVSHLAYLGDASVGSNSNIACGVVTVNYDGKDKHHTKIEDNAFIGCNVNLVAPVTIGEGSYIAAGSTITKDIPKNSLAIARKRETIKVDYVSKIKNRWKAE